MQHDSTKHTLNTDNSSITPDCAQVLFQFLPSLATSSKADCSQHQSRQPRSSCHRPVTPRVPMERSCRPLEPQSVPLPLPLVLLLLHHYYYYYCYYYYYYYWCYYCCWNYYRFRYVSHSKCRRRAVNMCGFGSQFSNVGRVIRACLCCLGLPEASSEQSVPRNKYKLHKTTILKVSELTRSSLIRTLQTVFCESQQLSTACTEHFQPAAVR